jgi:hypothetical protein
VAALAALVVFALAAWLLGSVLALRDDERRLLRAALVTLGAVLAAALAWFLRPAAPAPPPRAGDEALGALAAARARLGRGAFGRRPVVLVAGTVGSCKTTLVARAGVDAVLLAGDPAPAAPGDAPAPTAAANVWLAGAAAAPGDAGGAILVEPAGAVFADAARWQAFVRALRAPRLAAALGRHTAAPRRGGAVRERRHLLRRRRPGAAARAAGARAVVGRGARPGRVAARVRGVHQGRPACRSSSRGRRRSRATRCARRSAPRSRTTATRRPRPPPAATWSGSRRGSRRRSAGWWRRWRGGGWSCSAARASPSGG